MSCIAYPRRRGQRAAAQWWPLRWSGLLLCALALLSRPACAADTSLSREQLVKAAFVYNFTKFIDWPGESFANDTGPIVIGAYCSTAMSAELTRVADGRSINQRVLLVRRLQAAGDAASAHLVYVCAEHNDRLAEIRSAISSAPVVLVLESQPDESTSGTITFVLADGKLRFDIDTRAHEGTGLRISAQLQKLARRVHGRPEP